MKITCDKCGASYKIPEEKLTRDVSKATCKKCGEKIIIRRPGHTDAYEDPRLTGGMHASNDDDGVVEHNEERTVIAVVPELQRYDATPPLAAGGSVPDPSQSVGSMGLNPRQSQSVQPVAAPLPARSTEEPRRIQSPAPAPVSASQQVPVQPRPAPAPIPAAPVAAPAPVSASQMTAPVTAPSVAAAKTGSVKPVKRAAASWVAIPPLALAIVGLLLYIPQAMWGIANFQAVGFMLALFGSLAAIVLQVELIRSGSLNLMLGFLVPSLGVVGLGVGLLQTQEVPFLTEGVKDNLDLIIATAAQPAAPDAPSLSERVKERKSQVGKRPSLPKPGTNVDTTNLTSGDPSPVQGATGTKDGGGPGEVVAPEAIAGTGVLPISDRKSGREKSDFGKVADNTVNLDTEAISNKMENTKIRVCFTTSLNGMAAPKALEFSMMVDPSGKASSGRVISPSEFQGSALEKCLNERIQKTSFPTFEGTKAEKYTHKYFN